jgi:hypothetical protein
MMSTHFTTSSPFSPDMSSPLQSLDRQNCLRIRYWTKQEWESSKATQIIDVRGKPGTKGRQRIAAGINVNFQYIEDHDGKPITGHRLSAINNEMRQIWREFDHKGIAPATWHKCIASTKNIFRRLMYNFAPELQYCENHWKLEALAIATYPNFKSGNTVKENKAENDDADTESSDAVTTKTSDTDDYMHLPQKRYSTDPPRAVASKKAKKFKIPKLPKEAPESIIVPSSSTSTPSDTSTSISPSSPFSQFETDSSSDVDHTVAFGTVPVEKMSGT